MEVKLGLAVREDEEVMSPWLLPIPPVSDSPGDRVATLSSLLQVWLAVALWLQVSMVRWKEKFVSPFGITSDGEWQRCAGVWLIQPLLEAELQPHSRYSCNLPLAKPLFGRGIRSHPSPGFGELTGCNVSFPQTGDTSAQKTSRAGFALSLWPLGDFFSHYGEHCSLCMQLPDTLTWHSITAAWGCCSAGCAQQKSALEAEVFGKGKNLLRARVWEILFAPTSQGLIIEGLQAQLDHKSCLTLWFMRS